MTEEKNSKKKNLLECGWRSGILLVHFKYLYGWLQEIKTFFFFLLLLLGTRAYRLFFELKYNINIKKSIKKA